MLFFVLLILSPTIVHSFDDCDGERKEKAKIRAMTDPCWEIYGIQGANLTSAETASVKWNEVEARRVYYHLPSPLEKDWAGARITGESQEMCMRAYATGPGNMSVLVLGNSYSYRLVPTLLNVFGGRFSEFRLFARSSCMILASPNCDEAYREAWQKIVKAQKPDITIVIEKRYEGWFGPINGSIKEDVNFLDAQRNLKYISSFSKHVVIDYQFMRPDHLEDGIANIIDRRLCDRHSSFADLKLRYEDALYKHRFEMARTDALSAPNLIRNRVLPQLCKDYCYFFDRSSNHSYFGDNAQHKTREFAKLFAPGYKKIVDKLLGD